MWSRESWVAGAQLGLLATLGGCGPTPADVGGTAGGTESASRGDASASTTTTSSTTSTTSAGPTTSTTSTGPTTITTSTTGGDPPPDPTGEPPPPPPGCGEAKGCEGVDLGDLLPPSPRKGWSDIEGPTRVIVGGVPPVLCGNDDPALCDPCQSYQITHVRIPADVDLPGLYPVGPDDVFCEEIFQDCEGSGDVGGIVGGADNVVEVLAFTETCVAIADPCAGGALLVPRCD